jgi:RsiW-degrading membrane proteinase PrsW (M82 family)
VTFQQPNHPPPSYPQPNFRQPQFGRAYFRRRTSVVLTVVSVLCVLAVVILLGFGIYSGEGSSLLLGAVLALIPVGPVVGVFLLLDRWEPEPPKLLLTAFAWGATVAALTALIINSTADYLITNGGSDGSTIAAIISAPMVEEAAKGAFVLAIWLFLREEFDGVVDGVVYAGITAAGFAFTENILYFARAFDQGHNAGGGVVLLTFVLRGIFSPFAHPLFTSMTGIGIGIAAASNKKARWLAPIGGYLVAICLHSAWNASATFFGLSGFIGLYVLVMLPVGAAAIAFVLYQRKREQRVISMQLPWMSQAGWIAPSEIGPLASLKGRRQWHQQVKQVHGKVAARAVRDYQNTVTELAFLRRAADRGVSPQELQRRQYELLQELRAAATTVHAQVNRPRWAPPG